MAETLNGPEGPLTAGRSAKVRHAFAALHSLTPDERGLVLCWFCQKCYRYVSPGESCNCEVNNAVASQT